MQVNLIEDMAGNPVNQPMGMRPFSVPGERPRKEVDPVERYRKILENREGIETFTRESKYMILEDLVRDMHDNPPDAISSRFLGDPKRREFMKKLGDKNGSDSGVCSADIWGILPLIAVSEKVGDSVVLKEVTFGIRYDGNPAKDGERGYVDIEGKKFVAPGLISCMLEENILPYQGLKNVNKTYLLVTGEEFEKLKGYAQSKSSREQFLEIIDDEMMSREFYYALIQTAISKGASDIHIEPLGGNKNRVRFRVDGTLIDQGCRNFDAKKRRSIVQIVKTDAKLDISEKKMPQDGQIVFTLNEDDEETEIDQTRRDEIRKLAEKYGQFRGYSFRVATLPTSHGEKAVLRLLKSEGQIFSLDNLGYPKEITDGIRLMSKSPHGIMFMTGPTGSGKTTTTYSILKELNTGTENITTVEDPIEIPLKGINQTQVNPAKNYTFSTAPRALMRQDPDIIFIGETRDAETARTAIQTAETGHLVLSTLHTNDAIGSIPRLLGLKDNENLGVNPEELGACMLGVVAQRLVRTLCSKCKAEYDATPELNEMFGEEVFKDSVKLYAPSGRILVPKRDDKGKILRERVGNVDKEVLEERTCLECEGLGYRGRMPVAELWVVGDDEKELITQDCREARKYYDIALKNGMKDLMHNGLQIVLQGKTTLAELVDQVVPKLDFRKRKEYVSKIIRDYLKK